MYVCSIKSSKRIIWESRLWCHSISIMNYQCHVVQWEWIQFIRKTIRSTPESSGIVWCKIVPRTVCLFCFYIILPFNFMKIIHRGCGGRHFDGGISSCKKFLSDFGYRIYYCPRMTWKRIWSILFFLWNILREMNYFSMLRTWVKSEMWYQQWRDCSFGDVPLNPCRQFPVLHLGPKSYWKDMISRTQ